MHSTLKVYKSKWNTLAIKTYKNIDEINKKLVTITKLNTQK